MKDVDLSSLPQTCSARRVALAGLLALSSALGVGRFAFTPVMPMMQDNLGMSLQTGSLLALANYFGYLVGALLAIRFSLLPAHSIRGGLLLISATTIAMGLFTTEVSWCLLRFLSGAASAWVLVDVSAWSLERLALRGAQRLSGAVFGGVSVGITVVGLLCMLVLRRTGRHEEAWLTIGALASGVSLLTWRTFRGGSPTESPVRARPTERRRPWNVQTVQLVVCYGAFGFGYIIPSTYLPSLARALVSDPLSFGLVWPLFGLASLLSTLAGAALLQRFGQRKLWALAQLVMGLGVALAAWSVHWSLLLVSAACVGGTFMVVVMAALQEARRVDPDNAKWIIAAMTASFALGQLLGPLAVSWFVRDARDFSLLCAAATAALLLSSLALMLAPPRLPAPEAKVED